MFRTRRTSLLQLPLFLLLISMPLVAQPRAAFTVDVDSGAAPLSVRFLDASTPLDSLISWAWDLTGDGVIDSEERNPRWTYELPGRYTITLIVQDSTTRDTAVYADFIDVAPVEEGEIVSSIRVVEYSAPLAQYVELWGYTGNGHPLPITPISIRMPLDSAGVANFYRAKFLAVLSQNITDILVLDAEFRVLGKTGFSLPYKDLAAQRRRDAVVFLHRDLTAYQSHPTEQVGSSGWLFPTRVRFPWIPGMPVADLAAAGDAQLDPLYQTTLLLPPASHDSGAVGYAQHRMAHIRRDRQPVVFLPDVEQTRAAWGRDTDVITAADTADADFRGKRDYAFTSYPARLQRRDHAGGDRFDVWEYYYPPDQSWEESAYLFARDLAWLRASYDTARCAIAAHGMGGLLVRAYLEGTARNFTYFGTAASPIPYAGEIEKVVLLGTPHAGRLRAGLAAITPETLPLEAVMDRHAPALRELMPARASLHRLDPLALPADVMVLNIAGSAVSFTSGESWSHDDERTALSSAMYPAPRTINAVLGGCNAAMLQSPDGAAGQPGATDPELIPALIQAFLTSDSAIAAHRSRFLVYHPVDSLHFPQAAYQPPFVPPLRTDVGLPTLNIFANGQAFPRSARTRLRLDLSDGNRLHLEDIGTFAHLAHGGVYFYPASLCFDLQSATCAQMAADAGFLAVSRAGAPNPFTGAAITHDGLGWELPSQQHSIIPDPILSRNDDRGRRFDIARAAGDILLSWSREKRNALTITPHEAMLLDPRRTLRGRTPQPGDFVDFTVDCLTEELTVLLDYADINEPLLALMRPDGVPIGAADADDSTVFFTHNPLLKTKFITVRNPVPGDWRLLVDNAPLLPSGCRVASIAGEANVLHMTLDPAEALSRQSLTVTLALDPGGPSATNRSASCVLIDSTGTRMVIRIADDGSAPDAVADDGIFTGRVQLGRAGQYRIEGFYFADAGGCAIQRSASRDLVLPPSLELLAPMGGEEWRTGTEQEIRWQGVAAEEIAIDFSADDGVSWTQIAGPIPADAGVFVWTVPGFTSTQCRMRVRDIAGTISDTSTQRFTIYLRPMLTVRTPNGGEQWQVGSTHAITWEAIAVPRVDIAYSTDNGTRWLPLAADIPSFMSGYAWTVPLTASDSCRVRLVASDDAAVNDASDAHFRITAIPAVQLLTPNGGERWRVGSLHRIRWHSAEIDSVRIEFSPDAGGSWEEIARVPARDGEWQWLTPAVPAPSCLLRVTAVERPDLTDESDSVFAITPEPILQLLAPIGGERWEIGTRQDIRWASAEIARIDIEYSTDNGANWITATLNIPALDGGSYTWNVPTEPAELCRVRIIDTYDSARVSASPLPFRITESDTRPTLFAPVNHIEGESTRPILRWLPFAGALTYELQLTNDVTLQQWVVHETGLGSNNYQAPELVRDTKYFWRVRAYRSGWMSEWSALWEFTTSGSTLGTPVAAQPLNNAIGLPTTVNLRWISTPGADAYHLQVARDAEFRTIFHDEEGLTGLTAVVGALEFDRDYWWRLRAGNVGSTALSDWSRAWKFSTAPAPPRQLTPFDGLPDVPLHALLNWYPVAGARAYRLQVAADPTFETIVFDSAAITGTSVQLPRLWSFWTYFWRLTATTSRGSSDWCAPWAFRTIDIGTAIDRTPGIAPTTPAITAVWPQPAHDRLSLNCVTGEIGEFRILLYDILGREVRSRPVPPGVAQTITMDVTGLAAGPYLLRLAGNGVATSRIVTLQ